MLTITLPPQIEEQVRVNAAERGEDLNRYVTELIQAALHPLASTTVAMETTPEEWARRWDAWVASPPHSSGPASSASYSREEIYDDDGR